MGKTPNRKNCDYWGTSNYKWVSIADMENGKIIKQTKETISELAYIDVFKKKIVPSGTLIMSFKLTVGKVSILGFDGLHNEAIISIYPFVDTSKKTTNYLKHTLPFLATYGDTKTAIKGNTLNSESLNNLLIPLPPLAEQQRIVDKLEQILPHVDEYGKNEEKLSKLNETLPDKIKQSVLQYAVQGKLVEQNPDDEPASELLKRIKAEKEKLIKQGKIKKDKNESYIFRGEDNNYYEQIGSETKCINDEIPFEIPATWVWVRLSQITSIIGDGIHGTPEYTLNTEFYFINGNNLNDGNIEIKDNTKTVSEKEYTKYKKDLNGRTILVSINGTLGNVAFYNNEKVMLGKSACYFNLLSDMKP